MAQFFSSLFELPPALVPIFQSIWTVWSRVWWIVIPLITGMMLWETWKLYLHVRFLSNIKWEVLEIKIPKNVLKTPKAMEQIFAAAHTPYSYGYKWWQKYLEGRDEDFFSFEIVGRAGETHFYLRTPQQYRNMMESAIYGQYPEAEIVEVEDYLEQMPHVLPNKDLDVSGFEEIFAKPSPYPIRTYPMFEDAVEERRVDTVASFLESLSRMKGDQQFWLQMVIVPSGFELQKEGDEIINEILGIQDESHKKKGGFLPDFDLGFSLGEALWAPFEHPGEAKAKHEEKSERQQRFIVSPSKKDISESIGKKIGKFGFDTTLRFMYIERRGETRDADKNVNLAHAYIRQFNTHDMNQLRPDKVTTTASYAIHGFFKKLRIRLRKRVLYERYRHLTHHAKAPILNIEELATIYHFPSMAVTTSELEKVDSRKGTPPAQLPIVDDIPETT
jgi:hypothetical protein